MSGIFIFFTPGGEKNEVRHSGNNIIPSPELTEMRIEAVSLSVSIISTCGIKLLMLFEIIPFNSLEKTSFLISRLTLRMLLKFFSAVT